MSRFVCPLLPVIARNTRSLTKNFDTARQVVCHARAKAAEWRPLIRYDTGIGYLFRSFLGMFLCLTDNNEQCVVSRSTSTKRLWQLCGGHLPATFHRNLEYKGLRSQLVHPHIHVTHRHPTCRPQALTLALYLMSSRPKYPL